MTSRKSVAFRVCTPDEQPHLVDFLWSMREEFHFSERGVVEEIAQLLFAKGGVVGAYINTATDDTAMIGMLGYFLGEPSQQYANKAVGFVYIAGIAKAYRRFGVFCHGLHFLAQTLQTRGVTEMRCHARADDAYTNRLYARLGQAIGKEKNRRGDTCIVYAASMENALAMARRRRKPRAEPQRAASAFQEARHALEPAITS